MVGELGEQVYTSGPTTEWFCSEFIFYPFSPGIPPFLSDFMQRRLSSPDFNVDVVSATLPTPLLRVWAKAKLTNGTWKDVLDLAVGVSISLRYYTLRRINAPFCMQFTLPKVAIYQAIVEHLEATDRIADAAECFHQMTSELGEKIDLEWVFSKWSCISVLSDFRQRAGEKPEDLGDDAAAAQRYDEAISLYTTALSLKPRSPQGILVKRSKMYMTVGSWERALDDANQVHHFVTGRSIPLMHFR